ncbi:MAG: SWIM zinc finger family protein [Nocardioides alkalitolerans]
MGPGPDAGPEVRVTHPRLAPRRSSGPRAWWAKAWSRAVEEAAFSERDHRDGSRLARAGMVGAIGVGPGSALAAVRDDDDAWTVTVEVPRCDADALDGLVEVVAAESGRIAALLAGDLPHQLVEEAEEVGAELLPYGGELATTCTCPHTLDPCAHALAVLVQLGWLLAEDPFVLLALRGLPREDLMARLHARGPAGTGGTGDPDRADQPEQPDQPDELDVAVDAALRAARLLAALERGEVPDRW